MTAPPRSATGKPALEVARLIAATAGEVLLKYYQRATAVTWKGKSNLATDADLASEKVILDLLRREFPDHHLQAEESGNSGRKSEYTWLVDPLDGTNNFLAGIPYFCVTLALTRGDDILLGVTYDPLRRELFHSVASAPSYLNDRAISVSDKVSMKESLIGFDVGYNVDEGPKVLGLADRLWRDVHGLRLMGSAALGLAYVACGRMEVYCHRSIYPWDITAGILLVRNARGSVTDWEGNQATAMTKQIVAGPGGINTLFRKWCAAQA